MNDYEYNSFKFTSIVYLTDDILDLKANKETSSFDHISSNKFLLTNFTNKFLNWDRLEQIT